MDISTTVSFLCTRVTKPIEQDWRKLKRCFEFLNRTIEDVLILGADSLEEHLNFVDVSLAVHPDMRSRPSGGASFGKRIFMNMSRKLRMNTGGTTESSDYLPNAIWLMRFLDAQGYDLKINIMYQDNETAIKMERNGKKSKQPSNETFRH